MVVVHCRFIDKRVFLYCVSYRVKRNVSYVRISLATQKPKIRKCIFPWCFERRPFIRGPLSKGSCQRQGKIYFRIFVFLEYWLARFSHKRPVLSPQRTPYQASFRAKSNLYVYSVITRDVQRWKISEKQMYKRMFFEAKPASQGWFPGTLSLYRHIRSVVSYRKFCWVR